MYFVGTVPGISNYEEYSLIYEEEEEDEKKKMMVRYHLGHFVDFPLICTKRSSGWT